MSCTLIYSPTGNATEDYTKKVVGDDGGAALQKKTIEAVTQRAMWNDCTSFYSAS